MTHILKMSRMTKCSPKNWSCTCLGSIDCVEVVKENITFYFRLWLKGTLNSVILTLINGCLAKGAFVCLYKNILSWYQVALLLCWYTNALLLIRISAQKYQRKLDVPACNPLINRVGKGKHFSLDKLLGQKGANIFCLGYYSEVWLRVLLKQQMSWANNI